MSFNLTAGGVEKLFSLPGNEDRVPITVQVLEVVVPLSKLFDLLTGIHVRDQPAATKGMQVQCI
jgi:hypothetical protein